MRPKGFFGKPLFAVSVISVQEWPASAERNNPLPDGTAADSPPERNVQPLRRKSQRPAKIGFGSFGSRLIDEQPVERFLPFSTSVQLLPPSVVLYRPRSAESLQSLPGAHAYTVLPSRGSTRILAMRSESLRPMFVQVSPPSVDL